MLVDNIALPLAHRHDEDEELMVTHLVNQTVPGGPQLVLELLSDSWR
jgi:hypothetical protein